MQARGRGQAGDGGALAVEDLATAVEVARETIEPGLGLGDRDVIAEGAPPALRVRVVGFSTTPLRFPRRGEQVTNRTHNASRLWRTRA